MTEGSVTTIPSLWDLVFFFALPVALTFAIAGVRWWRGRVKYPNPIAGRWYDTKR